MVWRRRRIVPRRFDTKYQFRKNRKKRKEPTFFALRTRRGANFASSMFLMLGVGVAVDIKPV